MSEPKPQYQSTNGTYPDVVITAASERAELIEARAAVIKAGLALERALGLPPEKRQILDREALHYLTNK